jgi:ABC-2 type transport system permease protein
MTSTNIIPAAERKLKNRVGVGRTISNSYTLAYRALLKMFKNPEIFVDFVVLPVMFTLLFTFLFGGAISGNIPNYLPIVIPGVLLMSSFTNCTTAGTKLREDVDKGVTSRFKSMPIARIAPLAGSLTADLVRYVIGGTTVFVTGYILGYRPEAGIPAVIFSILFMMLVAWCLSWVFAFISLCTKTISTASAIGVVVMFPLVFLSNAFVPVETMPSWLQYFVLHINPLSRVVMAVRQLLTYGAIGADFRFALFDALAILVVFIPLTLNAYKRKS